MMIQCLMKLLKEVTLPDPFPLSYGTAGFRCEAQRLVGVATRLGAIAAVRSIVQVRYFIGMCISRPLLCAAR